MDYTEYKYRSLLDAVREVAVEIESAIDAAVIHGENHTAGELQDFQSMLEDILSKYGWKYVNSPPTTR